ncbi:MAG: hypothetical protein Q4E83_07900, partial [bacterium]|nr:hypothetical protein [bacterium]
MSDLRIDRIPEKFRKDAANFDDGDKLSNDEELSCFYKNKKITEDESMGLIVEPEKKGVVKPAGYVIGGAAILGGA